MMTADASAILFPSPPRAPVLRLSAWLVNVLFPPHCAACHAPVDPPVNPVLCRACAEKISWIGSDRCRRCGDRTGAGAGATSDCPSCRTHPPAFVEAACALGRFEKGPLRELVLSLKFGRKLHIAPALGRLLAARIRSTGLLENAGRLVAAPVPQTREQMRRAHWSHAEEIAAAVCDDLHLPFARGLLRKVRVTAPQATLKRMQRRVNLKGAFDCEPAHAKKHAGAGVLLIDDVITTGSTISECARTLHAAGFKFVRAAAIARA